MPVQFNPNCSFYENIDIYNVFFWDKLHIFPKNKNLVHIIVVTILKL